MSRHPGENLRRSDWLVERAPHSEARAAVELWHYSKSVPNTGQTFGLYCRETYPLSAIYGAALWLPPTKNAAMGVAGDDWQSVLSLSRLVVNPEMPRNAATFLLAGSMRLLDRDRWPVLVTYADTHHGHTGAIYKATGWAFDGETKPSTVYVDPDGRQVGRKRGPWNYTAAELIEQGCTPIQSRKLRFVHRANAARRTEIAA